MVFSTLLIKNLPNSERQDVEGEEGVGELGAESYSERMGAVTGIERWECTSRIMCVQGLQ